MLAFWKNLSQCWKQEARTFSGFVFFCAAFITLDDEAIICVMRFMELLA